jgi:hypothetical protein
LNGNVIPVCTKRLAADSQCVPLSLSLKFLSNCQLVLHRRQGNIEPCLENRMCSFVRRHHLRFVTSSNAHKTRDVTQGVKIAHNS